MKKTVLLTVASVSYLLFVTTAFAETSVRINTNTNSNSSSHTSINSDTNIKLNTQTGDSQVKIENNKFEIKGTISSVSGNDFEVDGQKIVKDSSAKINGNLETGKKVEVHGDIRNSILYATEINVSGSSNSGNNNPPSSQPTNSPTSSSSPSNSPTTSPTPSDSASPSASPNPENHTPNLIEIIQSLIKLLETFI